MASRSCAGDRRNVTCHREMIPMSRHQAFAPLPFHGEGAVGQFTQRAMRATEPSTDPVGHLANDRAVSVLHADELVDGGDHARLGLSDRSNPIDDFTSSLVI